MADGLHVAPERARGILTRMIALYVTIHVKPDCVDAFVAATELNHKGTLAEPGAHCFDVLRDAESATTFYLYEVYTDQAALDAHRESAHYDRWRQTVEPLLAGERTRILSERLFPA